MTQWETANGAGLIAALEREEAAHERGEAALAKRV